MSDTCTDDKNLDDDTIKLVSYAIVSIRSGAVRALPGGCGVIAVTGAMTADGFVAWMIARYCRFAARPKAGDEHPAVALPDADKKYLRVCYRVLGRWPQAEQRCCEEQVVELVRIRQALCRKLGPDGLVLYLPLDKIVDHQVLDVCDFGFPVCGDPRIEPDKNLGSVLAFGGREDYVDCGNDQNLSITGDLTLEAWVCPRGDMHGRTLLTKHFDGEYDLTFWKRRLAYYHGPDWHRNYHFFEHAFEPGEWCHIAVVRKADAKSVSFYLGGEKTGADYIYSDPPPASDNRLGIGYRLNTGANAFQGRMADVRIYRRTLDQSEIRKDMAGENRRS